MSCSNCTCGDASRYGVISDAQTPTLDRTCAGCGDPITGRHGFVSSKTGTGYIYFHTACPPVDA